jgi:hypothetical protein
MQSSGNRVVVFIMLMMLLSLWMSGAITSRTDSLHHALKQATDIETRINLNISLADLLKDSIPDSSLIFLDRARKLFCKVNSLPYLGKYFEIRGDLARNTFDFPNSTRLYKLAVFCFDKT